MHRVLRNALGAAVATSLLLTASSALAQEPKTGGTVIYANNAGPGHLDPHTSAALVAIEVIQHIFEPLVGMDENFEAKPMLAESFEISDDARTFTFHLRKGVKFHNGQEMTAEDVKASYERYLAVRPSRATLADVKEYRTPDPYTFIIELNEPNVVFIDLIKATSNPMMILPASQKDKPAGEIDIIGTGPFKLGEWVKDSHLVIEKFDDYVPFEGVDGPSGYVGKKTPYVDAVRYNFVPEGNARIAAMQTGEAHITTALSSDLAKRLDGVEGVTPVAVFPYCQQYIVLNGKSELMQNRPLRQAIRTVANIDDLIIASGETTNKNPTMMYPGTAYYDAEINAEWFNQADPEAARALLAEAGYNGEEIVVQTNTGYDYMRNSMIVFAEQLKEIGLNIKLEILDWPTNAANIASGEGGWHVTTTGFCSPALLGPQAWENVIYNRAHVQDNKVLDDAFATFFSSPKLEDRIAAWRTIEAEVLGGAYLIKVSDRASNRAYSDSFKGFRPNTMNMFWDVWLDE